MDIVYLSLCPCFLWKREEAFITWRYCRWPSGLSTDIRKASKQPFLKRPGLLRSESVLTWVAFSSPVKIICTFDSVPWLSMFPVWTTTWQNVFFLLGTKRTLLDDEGKGHLIEIMVFNQVVLHPMRLLLMYIPWILTLGPYESDKEEDGGDNEDHEYGDIVSHVELNHHVFKVDGVGGWEVAGTKACEVFAWARRVDVGPTWTVTKVTWIWLVLVVMTMGVVVVFLEMGVVKAMVVLWAGTFFNRETNSLPFLSGLVEIIAATGVYSNQWSYGQWWQWKNPQDFVLCIGDEKPDIIFSCVEVIIQMLRLKVCTRVVPNDGRVDRGGSL